MQYEKKQQGGEMNYYQHHIGDFDKTTRHLTRIERSIYRDLIELYYDTEQPLTLDRTALCRKILARSNEESTAVEQVLNEFFTETAIGWYHARCESEIERYHNSSSQKAQAGKASALKRAEKLQQALNEISTDVEQPLNDSSTNQQPITVNHEPVNPLSDKSDGVRLANGKQKFKDDAIQVLEFLNLKTGKHYRPLKANLDLIAARLAEGAQVSDCRGIIVRQARKWMGTDQEMYLRPATLFNATKFAQYSGEISHD